MAAAMGFAASVCRKKAAREGMGDGPGSAIAASVMVVGLVAWLLYAMGVETEPGEGDLINRFVRIRNATSIGIALFVACLFGVWQGVRDRNRQLEEMLAKNPQPVPPDHDKAKRLSLVAALVRENGYYGGYYGSNWPGHLINDGCYEYTFELLVGWGYVGVRHVGRDVRGRPVVDVDEFFLWPEIEQQIADESGQVTPR